ncbi:AzlD domain-containing protein [Staphylococcus gallinarum]|uniref:AzlD domain-containing protein n=1 Tax=Staphylococcus gallinarum TaxID=1293 RepID=UPI001E5654B5|nr:AzlD domain-containing protein [Staphylococcus gallinarum]MCD8793433.1 AzlD domain-containing protein [Staphylococcus gallinarum]
MTISLHMLIIILLCGLVTWLTRVIPFILITKIQLSEKVVKWLSFIPITLFTALIIDGVIEQHDNELGYTLYFPFIITMVPTILIAVITRSLTFTIIGGILIMALLRWLF